MGRRSQRHMVSGVTADNGLAPDSVNKEKKRKKAQKRYTDKENIKTSSEEVVDPVFQRKREDGSTSLAILTPGEGVVPGTERDRQDVNYLINSFRKFFMACHGIGTAKKLLVNVSEKCEGATSRRKLPVTQSFIELFKNLR